MTSGIYEIVNTVTGKRYVGSAVNLEKRELSHFSGLRRGDHRKAHFQHSFDKYGESAFEFAEEIINMIHVTCSLASQGKGRRNPQPLGLPTAY